VASNAGVERWHNGRVMPAPTSDLLMRTRAPRDARTARPAVRTRRLAALGLLLLGSASTVACARKLTPEDCDALLGRGIGLLAVASAADEPFTVESVRQRARPAEKKAIAELDAMCQGAADHGQRDCALAAKTVDELAKCGPQSKKAREVAEIAQNALAKRHSADACSKYGEHAVKIGAATVDQVGGVVRECDGFMNVGVFRCRMEATDAKGWNACE
jgi:hypothetical protein